ncbi:hypothetical protein LTR64_001696 [Lithohypha guttulata]|uniref:uncharacterized protein n=1 Tax=Lithohypha guttulata TaxID=1690604 RepID=UPI002DE1330A|nr:hypothetical protein LTR51_003890 [Lithohypha guttulata]
MAKTLSRVVLIGASGTVGSNILKALLEDPTDKFTISVLCRPSSTATFPEHNSLKVVKTALDDLDSLTNIFKDHDAIIHASAIPSLPSQYVMIKAAAQAGSPKRFILNEFANSYDQPGLPELEQFRTPKREILDVAKQTALETNGAFSWTGLATGNFLDYALVKYPQIGVDIRNRKARLIDGGEERFSATILKDIGTAVRGILRRPHETRNRMCHVRSVETCQREILGVCQRELREMGDPWDVESVDGKEMYERGREAFARGERNGMVDILVAQLFQRGAKRSIVVEREESDNDLLGVREKSIEEVVREVLKNF